MKEDHNDKTNVEQCHFYIDEINEHLEAVGINCRTREECHEMTGGNDVLVFRLHELAKRVWNARDAIEELEQEKETKTNVVIGTAFC